MLRFSSLGSGSTGNATLVEAQRRHHHDAAADRLRLLAARARAAAGARRAGAGRHRRGLRHPRARRPRRLRAAAGAAPRHPALDEPRHLAARSATRELPTAGCTSRATATPSRSATCELRPFTVPHDAREPLQLVLQRWRAPARRADRRGSVTAHMLRAARGLRRAAARMQPRHATLLAASSYPASLKARIGGPRGHLANEAAAAIARAPARTPALRHVVAAHLSERNNRPELAARRWPRRSALQRRRHRRRRPAARLRLARAEPELTAKRKSRPKAALCCSETTLGLTCWRPAPAADAAVSGRRQPSSGSGGGSRRSGAAGAAAGAGAAWRPAAAPEPEREPLSCRRRRERRWRPAKPAGATSSCFSFRSGRTSVGIDGSLTEDRSSCEHPWSSRRL